MKIKTALFTLALFAVTQSAFAAPRPIEKLSRGVEGLLTAPMEYWNEYQLANYKDGVVASVVTALLMGTAMTGKRIINGVYDILAFPVPYPKPYRILLNDPSETALDRHYSLGNAIAG